MQKTLTYIVALVVLSSAAYLIYTKAPRLPQNQTATSTAAAADDMTQTVKEETAQYSVNVTYRHFGSPAIDEKIDAAVRAAIAAFKQDAQQGPPEAGQPKYTFTGEATDAYQGNDFTSERINLYQDTGGAHGLPIVLTLNYDSSTGEEVSLDRALSLTGLTLADVSKKALLQLHQEFGDAVFEDGVQPKPENYQTFLVSPYKVTFIFQAYQAVAYAAGMPEVSFARR